MEILLILLLAGAVAYLWARSDKLSREVSLLSESIEFLREASSSPSAIASESGANTRSKPQTISKRASKAEEDSAPASIQSSFNDPRESEPVQAPEEIEPELEESVTEPVSEPATVESGGNENWASDDYEAIEERAGLAFDFEDIFGRRLPIWGGGFALAIAGVFLVRFSIEAGLLTPTVRVALGFLFGLGLLASAEAAFRFEERLQDPRVRQALAGAGLATLYGAFYLAGTAYGLIGAGAAFVGLAVVTAIAIGLSFRFGLPSAVIGLIGGFAAPLLVNSDGANVPLLSFYLALVTGGLAWTGQAQSRQWLSYAALAAGLGWGALMMLAGVSSTSDFAALGLYLVILGTAFPAFLHAKEGPSVPMLIAGAVATLQMAVLVSGAGFEPLTWGLYLLLGVALTALGWRFPDLRLGTLVGAGVGLWLLAIWPSPDPALFAAIAGVFVMIFAVVPLVYQFLGKATLPDLGQLSAVSSILAATIYGQFGRFGELETEPLLGACFAGLALLPAIAFAIMWKRGEEGDTRMALTLLAPAWLLAFASLLLFTASWTAPVMALLASLPLIWCYHARDAKALHIAVWTSAAITTLMLIVTPDFAAELTRLGDLPEPVASAQAVLRWTAVAALFTIMAVIGRDQIAQRVGEGLGVILVYGTVAQIAPTFVLAWLAAASAIGLYLWRPEREAAWGTALAIAGAWAFIPIAEWIVAGSEALIGYPFQASSAISPSDMGSRLAPLAIALGAILWRAGKRLEAFKIYSLLALGSIALVIAHSLYKQVFDINSPFAFELYGMGERTVWQALLMIGAYGALQFASEAYKRPLALCMVAAALAHFAWFTLILHNPLLTVQHVGGTPIANWILFAYVTVITGLWLAMSLWPDTSSRIRALVDGATMALISLMAFSLLRQVFAGSVLTSRAIEQSESLTISLLGIVFALGFLAWGSWKSARSWRIGSLVLMLIAVIKVFLFDAAGLEGLLRIASFMALGFSLIGIGWVYSRQLSRPHTIDT